MQLLITGIICSILSELLNWKLNSNVDSLIFYWNATPIFIYLLVVTGTWIASFLAIGAWIGAIPAGISFKFIQKIIKTSSLCNFCFVLRYFGWTNRSKESRYCNRISLYRWMGAYRFRQQSRCALLCSIHHRWILQIVHQSISRFLKR